MWQCSFGPYPEASHAYPFLFVHVLFTHMSSEIAGNISGGFFTNATQVTVHGGSFTTVLGDYHSTTGTNVNSRRSGSSTTQLLELHLLGYVILGIDLLQEHIRLALGAVHNSQERYDPPKCHPGTREAILTKILAWVRKDCDNLELFLWLYGPAGSGKSAIAQTIAEMCFKEETLAASFFFSRGSTGRNNEVLFICTLVYQLTISIPGMRECVEQALDRDQLLLSRSLEAQMEGLIVKPINFLAQDDCTASALSSCPRLILIDGLDECGEPRAQAYILQVLLNAARQLSVPFKFLIASRPEHVIREAFNENFLRSLTTTLVLDNTYRPDDDIMTFLISRFEDIKNKHPSRNHLPNDWPGTENIRHLVRNSSGHFIYVSTVIKYVNSHRHWPPDRLDVILGLSNPGMDTPFADLDSLYHHILSSVADMAKVNEIFYYHLLTPLPVVTAFGIENFFRYRRGEVRTILSDLHSIVSCHDLPDHDFVITFHHASFRDFLLDGCRSRDFFINLQYARLTLVKAAIHHMKITDGGAKPLTSNISRLFHCVRDCSAC